MILLLFAGENTKAKEISETFNDFFGFELRDEAWKGLSTNVPTETTVDITKAVVPNKIVERIRAAIGVHLLLPTATDTPGDGAAKLLAFKQIIDQCPLKAHSTYR